ncbi:arylsulfatase regulator [Microbacterium testaceum StLB037]|uniref:Arylsulfatase regulator n=2 Tax=Microbacterium testaceum TaxID=2033 RepID=E8N8Y6_MICTS|nr:arylsulfatase regulator [Microbacterium testaceum StLB037]
MYTGPDQSWRDLPVFMSVETARAVLQDIAQYADEVGLGSVSIVFHGGEPMLFPASAYRELLKLIDSELTSVGVTANLSIQTNATILRKETLSALLDAQVGFGVSADLSDASHDSHRVDKMGRGSMARVRLGISAIRDASANSEPQGGLFVIDPSVEPKAALERIESLGFPFVDVLLPDENWDSADEAELAATYGPWLLELFDLYVSTPRTFQIRWFQTVFKLALGGVWGSDSLGLRSAGTLIVETDGRYVLHDVLRTASYEVNSTNRVAGQREISEIAELPGMRAMMDKGSFLHSRCAGCDNLSLCGGGHIAHRYSTDHGLDNPSVYCSALMPLYERVRDLTRTGA